MGSANRVDALKLTSLQEALPQVVSHNRRISKRVLIGNGEIDALTGFSRAEFPPGEVAGAHRHADMTEVFLVESGVGSMQIDDERLELAAGMCITVEPGETHEIRNSGEAPLVLLYFGIRHQLPAVRWPAVVSYAGDAELDYIAGQSDWEALDSHSLTTGDRLIDADGTVFALQSNGNDAVEPQATGEVSLDELAGLVRAHAAVSGQCCVAKIQPSSIDEAIALVNPALQTTQGD